MPLPGDHGPQADCVGTNGSTRRSKRTLGETEMAGKQTPDSRELKDYRFRVRLAWKKHAYIIAELASLSNAERNSRVQTLLGFALTHRGRLTGDRPGPFGGDAAIAVGLMTAANDAGVGIMEAQAGVTRTDNDQHADMARPEEQTVS